MDEPVEYETRSFDYDHELDKRFYRRWDRRLQMWCALDGYERDDEQEVEK